MRVVVGCPVAERAWVLQDWVNSIRSQQLDGGEVEIVCLYTRSHDATREVLERNDVHILDSVMPTRPYQRLYGHLWSYDDHEYEYMAALRNELREYVLTRSAEYFLSLDSDILFPDPQALQRLISYHTTHLAHAVAPLVNMDSMPHLGHDPAWNYMYIRDNKTGADRRPEPLDNVAQVDVIMAAMLLGRRAQMVPWKNHPQGEDIGWSLKAYFEGLRLMMDTSVTCEHRMRAR